MNNCTPSLKLWWIGSCGLFERFDSNFKIVFEVIKKVKPILRATQHSTNPWCQVLRFLTDKNNPNQIKWAILIYWEFMQKYVLSSSAPSFHWWWSLNRILPRFKSAVQSGLKTRPSPGSKGEIAGENVVVFSLQSSSCRIFGSNIGVSSGITVATGIMAATGVLEQNTHGWGTFWFALVLISKDAVSPGHIVPRDVPQGRKERWMKPEPLVTLSAIEATRPSPD